MILLRALALVGLVGLVAAGCTHFDPIPRGVCGNGIVEPGEDCDSSDAACIACAVACTSDDACPSPAYACGTDGFCHAPGGAFAAGTPPSLFLVDDYRVSDLDGDGIADVLGVSQSSLSVRRGDPQEPLGATTSTVTPILTASPGFADLDGDGAIDVATAAPDGVVAYTSRFGTPSPEVAPLVLDAQAASETIYDLFPLDQGSIGTIAEYNGVLIAVANIAEPSGSVQTGAPLCGGAIPPSDFSRAGFDSYLASAAGANTIDEVISVLAGTGAARRLCVMAIHVAAPDLSGQRAVTFSDITPAGTPPVRRPVLADLDFDSDPCPGLVDSDGGGQALTAWDGAMSGGVGSPAHCTLGGLASLPGAPGADGDAAAIGRIPISPTILGVARDALVLTSGAYVPVFPATFEPIFQSTRKLALVGSGDLDGDGAVDAVLAAEGAADLDVIYRVKVGITPGFELSRLPTTGAVGTITIGDFDGNGTGDIAYAEHLLGYEGMSVAYGFPGHTYTELPEAALDQIAAVIPYQLPTSTDPLGVVGDLVVLAGPPDAWRISLLEGSAQRTLISYFDPRPKGDLARGVPWRALVAGNFSAQGGEPFLDLLTFLVAPGTTSSGLQLEMYRLDGVERGFDSSDDPLDQDQGKTIDDPMTCPSRPDLPEARLIPWTTGPGHDVVVGVDPKAPPQAFVLDPWDAGKTLCTSPAPYVADAVPAGAVVHTLRAVDVDGDGRPELVAAFGPPPDADPAGAGLVEVCPMGDDARPAAACTDLDAVVGAVLPGAKCVDAAPGRFRTPDAEPSPGNELAVLCHDATGDASLVAVDATASGYAARVLARHLGPARSLQVGDVTGDRVDDAVVLVGTGGGRSIVVLAQCTSRDLACRAASSGGP